MESSIGLPLSFESNVCQWGKHAFFALYVTSHTSIYNLGNVQLVLPRLLAERN